VANRFKPVKTGRDIPDLCTKLLRRAKAYCLVTIDGADNVKVAGDLSRMAQPANEIQEMFGQMVVHVSKGARILQEMAQTGADIRKQSKLVQEVKDKRSKELETYGEKQPDK